MEVVTSFVRSFVRSAVVSCRAATVSKSPSSSFVVVVVVVVVVVTFCLSFLLSFFLACLLVTTSFFVEAFYGCGADMRGVIAEVGANTAAWALLMMSVGCIGETLRCNVRTNSKMTHNDRTTQR